MLDDELLLLEETILLATGKTKTNATAVTIILMETTNKTMLYHFLPTSLKSGISKGNETIEETIAPPASKIA